MTAASIAATATQLAGVSVGAPLLSGVMRQVRARLEGRAGAGVGQPWRDLRKLMRKQSIRPHGTSWVFWFAPIVLAATTVVIACVVPIVTTASPLNGAADLFAVIGLLFIGTVALAAAGLDTATAFGGMGASREMTIAALVEPTILLAVFAVSIPANSSSLDAIVSAVHAEPGLAVTPPAILALVALVVVVIAETGRLPVDNPSTHLELTMIHEAMILEYAGPRLALIEWASSARLTVLLALLANLFLPWGIAGPHAGVLGLCLAIGAIAVKVTVLAVGLAAAEVFLAKLRLFRVPELLAGSFAFALLAVTASGVLR
jgi:formate hydrogenlyase subunit 4